MAEGGSALDEFCADSYRARTAARGARVVEFWTQSREAYSAQ